ncbi:MAG TPA: NAD-dependent epimerase/dehydratase family protein [Candidatus Hydrogenedentes bacterium]|nr:NAD-dependent epimerase/dehydratase family protein [Candidatus Hydrogenedentota bacterium]
MRAILVTGGAGFVGSWLAIELKRAFGDARVIALDNLRRRGGEWNLPRLRAAGVQFMHGDVRNLDDLAACGPIDCLVEASAEPSVLAGFDGASRYVVDTNLGGAVNCLELARRHQAVFVFLSTSRVYPIEPLNRLRMLETDTRFELAPGQPYPGASPAGIAESFPLEGCRSLYGATKLSAELLAAEYGAMYGFPVIINRCGVLAGPWQMGRADQGIVAFWAARHVYGGSLRYIGFGGSGRQTRDILHPRDLARLVLEQVRQPDRFTGRPWNVGGGRRISVSLRELTALCAAATGRQVPVTPDPEPRPADIPLYLSDHAAITAACGWQPRVTAEAIVEEIVQWIRDHEATLRPVFEQERP